MTAPLTLAVPDHRRRSVVSLEDLQPEQQIEAVADGVDEANDWRSTGIHPTFLIAGPLRAGWWRIRARIRRLDDMNLERVQADFRADFGDGFDSGVPLERVVWNGELDDPHIFIHLPRPAVALRFQPLSAQGVFRIDEFSAERMSRAAAMITAVHRKLRLLREYNCTGRVLGRGLKLLFTLRLGEIHRKLFKALPDTRRYNPETDAYLRSITGLGRWRVPPTNSELQTLREAYRNLPSRPTIAVVFPVHEMSAHALDRGIESVVKQVYEEWELHLVLAGDAPLAQVKVADNRAQRNEKIRVTLVDADSTIDDALADVMDRIEADHVVFFNPGFELTEDALLHLMKTRLANPDLVLIMNAAQPPQIEGRSSLLSGSAFRPGAAGQQVNLYRTADLRALDRLPSLERNRLPVGTEAARRLPVETRSGHLAEIFAYPISCLTTLPSGAQELEHYGKPPSPILLTGNICGISGWDNVVFEIARGLHSLGASVRLNAACHHQADLLPPYLLPARRPRRPGDMELVLAPPHLLAANPHPPGCAIFTMWESDRLESAWVHELNRAAVVLVPSQWAVDTFRASGVTAPIEIVSLGHDSLTFHANSEWPSVCTFGTAAALWGGGIRKNTQRLIEAFSRAFLDENDIRLRVKITPKCELAEVADPRIEILRSFLLPGELADWYRSLTAFVNGSSAEGFGLHLVEAMACGRPVISTSYSAVTEYFDETVGFPIAHRLATAEGTIYSGHWAELDEDELVIAMRQVYENDAEARRRGQQAATRTRRFTWKEAGRKLLRALETHLRDRLTV